MLPLTKRQKEILDYIREYIEDHEYAPTYREIGEKFEFSSVATVAAHIDNLKDKGALEKSYNEARSLMVNIEKEKKEFEIPLLGTIAAGEPIEAIQTRETITIPKDMMGRNVFALKVRGDSMIGDGIYDGDYVIVEKTSTAQNGDIVVALLNGEKATLKRFQRQKQWISLFPRNPRYKPIRTRKVLIQGKVRGVIRKFA